MADVHLPSPEQIAALEATATMATSVAFATSNPREAVIQAANDNLGANVGLSVARAGLAGTTYVGARGSGLSRVFVRVLLRGEGSGESATLHVQMTGLVHERVPLMVSATGLGLAGAAATFWASFQLGIDASIAAVLLVVAMTVLILGWLRLRAASNDRITQDLHRAFSLTAVDCGAKI